jgi:hypothetical protein
MAVKRWNGSSWDIYAGTDTFPVKVTDGRPGKTTFIGATTPSSPTDGDVWIDQDTSSNSVLPTALSAKGDLFAATGSGTYSNLAAGSNGSALVADSTQAMGLNYVPLNYAGKNLLINGAFDIWQRGTSITQNAGTGYTADRWMTWITSGGGAGTFTRQTGTGEFRYSIRVQRNAGNTDAGCYYCLANVLETSDSLKLAGKIVTYSFWARAGANYSSASNVLFSAINYGTSVDQSNLAIQQSTEPIMSPHTLTTSWQKFTYSGLVPSNATQVGFRFYENPSAATAGANDYFEVTGVQLEIGPTATPFSRAGGDVAGELAKCQRYFYRLGGLSTNNPVGTGFINATAQTAVCVTYPVTMRSAPGFSATGGNNYNVLNGQTNYTSSSITANSLNINNSWIYVSTLGMPSMPVGSASYVFAPSATSYLDFSAEL